mgnify:CR=1 FL=1
MEIEGYEDYLIYDDGLVYSKKRKGRFMKPGNHCSGYKYIDLFKNGKRKSFTIHRLVALHYIANPENKPELDHIDRDKSNNHVSNLRWVTRLENQQNLGDYKNNKSGVKNVSYHKQGDGWIYSKKINEIRYEKFFKTFEEAVECKTKFETIHK